MSHRSLPVILMAEPLSENRVRLFFSTGKIADVIVPGRAAERAKVVFGGVGLDIGDGREMSAATLHTRPGKVWTFGSEKKKKASRST